MSDIWDYTVERWGAEQAETYVRQLGQRFAMLADRPRLGRPCAEIRADYYRFRSGSHIVFYLIADDGIVVVRVLHERMDVGEHL